MTYGTPRYLDYTLDDRSIVQRWMVPVMDDQGNIRRWEAMERYPDAGRVALAMMRSLSDDDRRWVRRCLAFDDYEDAQGGMA